MKAGSDGGRGVAGQPKTGMGGRSAAFDLAAVVTEYESPLLRYVARLIGTRYDEAQDVVQDTFLKLHSHIGKNGAGSIDNLRCWLYRVAHNLAMDCGRSRRRRHELAEKALSDPAIIEQVRGARVGDARDCEHGESVQAALDAVSRLPDDQRNVVLLKTIQGLTLREISEITGMKMGTVNYRLTQGLRSLAAQLKGAGAL